MARGILNALVALLLAGTFLFPYVGGAVTAYVLIGFSLLLIAWNLVRPPRLAFDAGAWMFVTAWALIAIAFAITSRPGSRDYLLSVNFAMFALYPLLAGALQRFAAPGNSARVAVSPVQRSDRPKRDGRQDRASRPWPAGGAWPPKSSTMSASETIRPLVVGMHISGRAHSSRSATITEPPKAIARSGSNASTAERKPPSFSAVTPGAVDDSTRMRSPPQRIVCSPDSLSSSAAAKGGTKGL